MSIHFSKPKSRLGAKIGILSGFVVVFAGIGFLALQTISAHAAITNWDPGNIINDAVFTNNSMSASQIQTFLNSKVPICDTGGTLPASDWGRPDLTHKQYAELQIANAQAAGRTTNWTEPPYVCLRDYTEGGLTAAQIIYNLSQQYQINPEVLIVLLQKEQGLVLDTWPLPAEYRTATGYGCPDSSGCDAKYYGLTAQLTWSATMFHAIVSNNPVWSNPYGSGTSWFTPYILGNNLIQWNPVSSCGNSTVNIENRATQALYNYTPYQPDAAALAAGYGNGDACSSYGNRNFYLYFTDWFGSTQVPGTCTGTETPNSFVRSFYNRRTFEHFYSAYDCDINFLQNIGYVNEGAVFNTTPSTAAWAVPIYRYYNPTTGLHVWSPTLSTPAQLLASGSGYQQEAGIVFYVAQSTMPGVNQIMSYYNPKTYQHVLGPALTPQQTATLQASAGYGLEGPAFSTQ